MKKLMLFTVIFIASGLIFSCNKSSDSDSNDAYIDPGNWSGFTIPNKSYTISSSNSDSCVSSTDCCAIIYQGELNDTNYVGIAADNRDEGLPPTYIFKMYWNASEIPTGSGLTLPSCTIKINDQTASGINITNATITNEGDGTYTISFSGGPYAVGTETLTDVNMRAYKYP
jgi:hypothetical protein